MDMQSRVVSANAAHDSDRWEDRHSAPGSVRLTRDEWIAVNGTHDDGPPFWSLLVALIVVPVIRYWRVTLVAASAFALYAVVGGWSLVVAAAACAVGLVAWRRLHRRSYEWIITEPLLAWRRRQMYRRKWRLAMDRVGLGARFDAISRRRHRPRLIRIASSPTADVLLVDLLPRQSAADVANRATDLAYSFGMAGCWVTSERPATQTHPERVTLTLSPTPIHTPRVLSVRPLSDPVEHVEPVVVAVGASKVPEPRQLEPSASRGGSEGAQ